MSPSVQMHRYVVAVFVMLSVVIILITTHYPLWNMKTAQCKDPCCKNTSWRIKGHISVREVERHLQCRCISPRNTSAVGTLSGFTIKFLLAEDVPHTVEAMGQKEYDHAIHQWPMGAIYQCREILEVEPFALELILHLHQQEKRLQKSTMAHIPDAKVPWRSCPVMQ